MGAVAPVDLIGQVDVGSLRLPVAGPLVVWLLLEVRVVETYWGAAVACIRARSIGSRQAKNSL